MNVPDQPVQVPVDDPNADTEWNDILRKHGIIPEKPPSPTLQLEAALLEAVSLAHEHRLEGLDLDDLDALEDTEDDAFLEVYRQKRIRELDRIHSAPHGSVYPLSKPGYTTAVTEASDAAPVLVNLVSAAPGQTESRVLGALWREAAKKYPDVKFCEMRADLAIEGYPEKNCPTVLVYHFGEIVRQVVTLREWGGPGGASLRDVERLLVEVKAVRPEDHRLHGKRDEEEEAEEARLARSSIKFGGPAKAKGRAGGDEDEDDWE